MGCWCEHIVPQGLGHVLVSNQGGMEAVQLKNGGGGREGGGRKGERESGW